MATYYVDSNATGLNDGSSWTDAWTALDSSLSVSAGDTVLVASNHSEINTVTKYYHYNSTLSAPVSVISTNKTSGAYERGAFVRCSNGSNQDTRFANARFYGFDFEHDRQSGLGRAAGVLYMRDCTFTHININGNGGFYLGDNNVISECVFDDCTFDIASNYTTFVFSPSRDARHFIFNNCTVNAGAFQSRFFQDGQRYNGLIRFSSCDISSVPEINFNINYFSGKIEVSKCKIPSSWVLQSTVITPLNIEITDCDSGTISGNSSNYQNRTTYGRSSRSTTEYRSGGANDSIDDYSLKLETDSIALENLNAAISPEISKWVDSGSQTITVYIAGGASLNDDDFWIEVESPSELASPTAQGKFRTTKPDPLATPTALTSDTSSWTGTGVGTAQKVEVAISPTIAGTVTVRCYLAKPSTTVYVDPKISIGGYQRVHGGVLVDGYPVVSSTTPSSSATYKRIIDNAGSDFSLTGTWNSYGILNAQYGSNYNYSTSGTGANVATYSFTGLPRGVYQVAASWYPYSTHTASAPYKVYVGNNLVISVTKNQSTAAASDYLEGAIEFEKVGGTVTVTGGSLTVTIDDNAGGGYVLADAIRLEMVSAINTVAGTQVFPFRQWVEDKAIAGTSSSSSSSSSVVMHPLRSN